MTLSVVPMCKLYALGEYIGFTAARDGLQRGAVNTREHCFAAETILKGATPNRPYRRSRHLHGPPNCCSSNPAGLSGDNEHTSTVGVGGSELPLWQFMLPDLGFTRVEECAPGDIVVYTLVSELTARRIAFMQDPAVAATSPQPDEVCALTASLCAIFFRTGHSRPMYRWLATLGSCTR